MAIVETYDVSYRIKGWFDPLADVAGWYDFDLVSPSGPPAITGGAVGTSADSATLEAMRIIQGAATGTGIDAATIEAKRVIQGAAAGSSADAATLRAMRVIIGAAVGTAQDTAAVQAMRRIVGSAAGSSADAAALGTFVPPPPTPPASTEGGAGEFVQDRQPRRLARGRAQRFKFPNDARRTIPQLSSSELDESAVITWGDVVHAESAWFADAPPAWHGLLYAEVDT